MKGYYARTANGRASPLLTGILDRASFGEGKLYALDLGCGSGSDTLELLKRGWSVTAVDASQEGLSVLRSRLKPRQRPRVSILNTSFEELRIPRGHFHLVNASYALPFCSPEAFPKVWKRVTLGLKGDGIFCGQLFGRRDTWAADGEVIAHTRTAIRGLFRGFEILLLEEFERDARGAASAKKHWHVFNWVARRR